MFKTRYPQNCIFEVGGYEFSTTNVPILLKFCTLLSDKLTRNWTKDFFFFDYNLSYKLIHGLIFTENRTVLHTTLPEIQILIFFQNPFFNHELYSPTNRKYLIFWCQIKLSRVILAAARILFSIGSPKTSSQWLSFQYFFMKISWSFVEMLFFHMSKARIK